MAENERRGEHQKQKLLYLAKLFTEETDAQHALGMAEIIEKLAACGVNADRKTLYLDFGELQDFGMDIEAVKAGRNTLYRLSSRRFELPELKLLVDSVQSAKFITDKKSKELIAKLESLVSRHEATQLQRQVIISDRIKTMNTSVYYNVRFTRPSTPVVRFASSTFSGTSKRRWSSAETAPGIRSVPGPSSGTANTTISSLTRQKVIKSSTTASTK